MFIPRVVRVLAAAAAVACTASAEDGYRLWLRYEPLADAAQRARLAEFDSLVIATPSGVASPTVEAACQELQLALGQMLGMVPELRVETAPADRLPGPEGYSLQLDGPGAAIRITGGDDAGALYGAFALLRKIQTATPVDELAEVGAPRVNRRLLNHWDDLDGVVERVTSGHSLWEWFQLPWHVNPRYRDYARACASVGINGTVLTNVNANALVLTPAYLDKVAALADAMRPYNVRVYLTARFSAPMEIGGLKTADPLDPDVARWWKDKADEIYARIPDFGGFLVKANSEGQPGPQDYKRSHAEGANMLADAVAPHGGIVMWRAFVYSAEAPEDRVKQAYTEFQPLDGLFRPNVVVQIKNGPLDFMPREPFHPLFGAMPETALGLELQITQEYLGFSIDLAFLAPMWEEVLDSDTYAQGAGSTVARVVAGSLDGHELGVMAGVSNVSNARNWTGHPMGAANWYAFGRLAWDPSLPSARIAEEWTRMTFSNEPAVVEPITHMLMESREAVVNYEMPLGLHHIMAMGTHYGPGPWADQGRADWTSVYYHRADKNGIGFNRSASGSNALEQYAPEVAEQWGSVDRVPDELLLWFHHVPWTYKMRSGRTLWDELALHYQAGVDSVRAWRVTWDALKDEIDPERWAHVRDLLARQEYNARTWRDACLLYFQTFSGMPLPDAVEAPEHDLDHYKSIRIRHFPGHPGE